jgi:nitrite reductase/ring-hydroxylating ferredoxin subunit
MLSCSIRLCASSELLESAQAIPFDVKYYGQVGRGFAIRFEGQAHAYLNRCTHVPMEMDYQPNRIFDDSGRWLMCATHGATYWPKTGDCIGGPCRGGLVKIVLSETAGEVHWHTSPKLQPLEQHHD